MNRTIQDFLMHNNARISYGNRWLVMDVYEKYTVYEHRYCAKKVTVLYDGNKESEAIDILSRED
jgi:hypothetical protein